MTMLTIAQNRSDPFRYALQLAISMVIPKASEKKFTSSHIQPFFPHLFFNRNAARCVSLGMPAQTYKCSIQAEPLNRYQPGGYHPLGLGEVLQHGHYKIIHKLGWGSYSTTWAAKDQKHVYLKKNCSNPLLTLI